MDRTLNVKELRARLPKIVVDETLMESQKPRPTKTFFISGVRWFPGCIYHSLSRLLQERTRALDLSWSVAPP